MNDCKFGYDDCCADPSSCFYCSNGMKYEEPKKRYKLKKKAKADNRKGSSFEYVNHERNKAILSSKMTINSGATDKEKGDENLILGSIRVMEELKTQEATRTKGCKSFAIKREWLNKLHTEALERNFDFWYLKFAFNEEEAIATRAEKFSDGNPAGNTFVVIEQDVIMSIIQRLAQSEIKRTKVDSEIEFYKKQSQAYEAENVALKAKIEELKARIKMLEPSEKTQNIEKAIKPLETMNSK